MARAVGVRNELRYLCISFLCLALLQAQLVVCHDLGNILSRALRSIPVPEYQTTAKVQSYVPLYAPKTPFLGELSENLSEGKIIRISGHIPADVNRFQVNLCDDCSNGPLNFHFDVRYTISAVVRNTYANDEWQPKEERDSLTDTLFPFEKDTDFVLQFEVTPEAYLVSLNGVLHWEYNHRINYSSVDTLEIKDGPLIIWKIEYTDKAHEAKQEENEIFPAAGLNGKTRYELNGDAKTDVTISVAGKPYNGLETFTMDLKCECTPQHPTFFSLEELPKKTSHK